MRNEKKGSGTVVLGLGRGGRGWRGSLGIGKEKRSLSSGVELMEGVPVLCPRVGSDRTKLWYGG